MSLDDGVLDLIGDIYDAGVEPGLWDATLVRLGERFRANGGILMTTAGESNQLRFVSEFGAAPEWQALYNQEYHKSEVNPLFPAFRRMRPGVAAADWMLLPKEALEQSPFYNEWSLPQDRCGYFGVVTSAGSRSVGGIMFSRGRRFSDFQPEEIAVLQALSPHLIRAVAMSRHLGALAGRRQLYETLLDAAAGPLVVVELDGRIVFANEAAWRILHAGDGLCIRRNRLAAVRSADNSLLRRRIKASDQVVAARETLTVMRRSGARPYGVVATPVPVDAAGLTLRKKLIAVFIADPDASPPDMSMAMQAAYGLTQAEAALVLLLAREAPSLTEAADQLGVSLTTVKTHLKHCFEKTGAQRQTELMRLALATSAGFPRSVN